MAAPLDDHPTPHSALAELSGTVLERRYALGRVLGAGGMGAVFEAIDLRLERAVAIKVLRPVFAGHGEYIKRFLREAQAASKIRHRNVVVILDYGEAAGGLVYSVMELCVGQDLEQLLRGQPEQRLPWAQAHDLLVQIAGGLRAAHGQGVIHRDIKPANCFVTHEDDEPVIKVVDFGIAKLEDAAQTQQLTSTGNFLGTPSYIAPELVRTQSPASPRSDVYSLGVVAYRMLTGTLPFLGETAFEVMRRACMDPVPLLRTRVPDLPVAVEELVLDMLAKDPEQRPADMGVVKRRLQLLVRKTLGALLIGSPGSSALQAEEDAVKAPHSAEDRTTLPREVAHESMALPPLLASTEESTAVQLAPLPEDFGRRGARSAGAPSSVVVAGPARPRQLVSEPSPARAGETLSASGHVTLRMGASTPNEHLRRSAIGWLVLGGLVVSMCCGSIWIAMSRGGAITGTSSGDEVEGAELVTVESPSAVTGAPPSASVVVETPPAPKTTAVQPAKGEASGTSSVMAIQQTASAQGDRSADILPKSTTRSSATKRPSDATIEKRIKRQIESKCATVLKGQRVSVGFIVTKSGGTKSVTARPNNVAGTCAKQYVEGTVWRPRKDEDTIQIVVD